MTMPEEPLSPEREALLAVAMAGGDIVDLLIRVVGVMEQQSEHLAVVASSLRGIRSELADLATVRINGAESQKGGVDGA